MKITTITIVNEVRSFPEDMLKKLVDRVEKDTKIILLGSKE